MGAADIFKLFQTPQESFSEHIYRRASYDSPWLNVVPRAEFKEGSGLTQTTFRIGNTEPVSVDEDWPAVTLSTSGGTTAPCATVYTSVRPGYTIQTYAPEQFGLLGPILCKDDPIYEHRAGQFITNYMQELAKRAKRSWENRNQSIYHQYCTFVGITDATTRPTYTDGLKKFWASETLISGYGNTGLLAGATYNAVASAAPTVTLNQNHLDWIAMELIQRGATNPDSNGFITLASDGPVFSLLISPEASRNILKEDTATGFRTDVRYGAENELMKRIGATKTLLNFRHVPDVFPPRYGYGAALSATTTNTSTTLTSAALFGGLCVGMPAVGTGIPALTYVTAIASTSSLTLSAAATASATVTVTFGVAGKYHRVQTFDTTSVVATQGLISSVTTGYKNAPYESATVISPYVFTSEMIRPVNAAGGVNWDPTNYMGEWQFIAGANNFDAAVTDPLKKRGAHIAEFKHAPRPEFPEYGMVIIYKRA